MKAILLAAGFGTRLRPLTDTIPKCLVPIKNRPLLDIWLGRLTDCGINSFLINTHYLPNKVEEFINNSQYQKKCKVINEKELLGTAGTLVANFDYIGKEECILIHADNYCMADLKKFILQHKKRPSYCLLTMMTFKTKTPSSCGIIETDRNGVVIQFHEKVKCPPSDIANGAVYILSKEFIKEIKHNFSNCKDFTTEILTNFLGKIYTYHTNEVFIDIGTPETYKEANDL